MSTAVSVSMQEAAISISDWLLSFLKARNPDLYSIVYHNMFAALERKPLDVGVFNLLLKHHEEVFDVLKDVKAKGSVSMKVPNQNVLDGRGEWIEKVKKSGEVLREAEEFFIVLLEMAVFFDEQESSGQAKLGNLLFEITRKTEDLTEFRLKLIMFAYNMLPEDSSFRWATFKTFLSYAAKTNLFHLVVPYLELVDEWQKEWNLNPRQKRELYGLISEQLTLQVAASEASAESTVGSRPSTATSPQQRKRNDTLFHFQRKYVESCDGESKKILDSAETVDAAAALVESSLKETDVTNFDRILSLDAVRNLKTTKHACLVELLEVFVRGGPSDLISFKAKNPGLFETGGLDYGECLSKCHLLKLTSLAGECTASSGGHGVGLLKIRGLASDLCLDEAGTERLLVQAIGLKFIEAKIDQVKGEVTVTSAMQREFGRPQWAVLLTRLSSWNDNTRRVVAALKKDGTTAAVSTTVPNGATAAF